MKKKKKLMILAVLLLAVGFAAVTTTLNINGDTTVGTNQDDFDVYFSKATEKINEAEAIENNEVIIDDTHIKFTTDMKSIGDTYVLEYDVTNGSRNYDANIIITCTPNGNDDEYLKVTNAFDTTETLKATETRTGTLTVELIKSYVGTETETTMEKEIKCTINGNAVERTTKATGTPADKVKNSKWVLTNDVDGNGQADIGDLITLGTESFYVYNTDGDNIKALAQYNLLVGNQILSGNTATPLENETGLQEESAKGYLPGNAYPRIGTIAFDSSGNNSTEYEISTIKTYVDAYGEKLNSLNGEITSIGLITKGELEALGCNSSSNTCKDSQYAWTWSTSYWISSYFASRYTWIIFSDGRFDGGYGQGVGDDYCFGVRPVITISKSLIK